MKTSNKVFLFFKIIVAITVFSVIAISFIYDPRSKEKTGSDQFYQQNISINGLAKFGSYSIKYNMAKFVPSKVFLFKFNALKILQIYDLDFTMFISKEADQSQRSNINPSATIIEKSYLKPTKKSVKPDNKIVIIDNFKKVEITNFKLTVYENETKKSTVKAKSLSIEIGKNTTLYNAIIKIATTDQILISNKCILSDDLKIKFISPAYQLSNDTTTLTDISEISLL